MTPKICFAAVAVIRDAETNNISAFNILEVVGAAGLPFLIQNVSFFVLWQREPQEPAQTEGRFSLSIGDQVLHEMTVRVDFQGGLKNRSIVNLNGLVVPNAGPLRFRFQLENQAVAEYIVDVTAPPPVVAQAR